MYSTHTSSSYSPSISDGTLTPNSLHHQHLTIPTHLPFPNSSAAYDEETLQTQRLQREKPNGIMDGADYDNDDNNERIHKNDTKLSEDNNADNNIVKTNTNVAESGEEHQQQHQTHQQQHQQHLLQQQQLKRHGRHHRYAEHALRIPSKLRKIDRDSALVGNGATTCGGGSGVGGGGAVTNAVKFDKLTGDGIKSGNNAVSADGSYQCQFCDKSFPRLGYLKKHEQVS